MKIFACIKQVPDTETKIKLSDDKSHIEDSQVKWIINPYDEFAIEEALTMKSTGDSVRLLSLGPDRVTDALRTGLAMGADEATLIEASGYTDNFSSAKALSKVISKCDEDYIVFTGKLSIDNNGSSVGQMIAEFLQIPHASVVSKFEHQNKKVLVERDVEKGIKEILELEIPCVITTNKGLNTPRYASLPGIMKAKKKSIERISIEDLEINSSDEKIKFSDFKLPAEKPVVKILEGDTRAKQLVDLLRTEAKIL